jgi:hypothetical protein
MACESSRKRGQTLSERVTEVKKAATAIDKLIAGRNVKVIVRNGAIAFDGIPDATRDGLTDACIYRRIMSTGSYAAKQAIAAAGPVSKQALAAGIHSHDGGASWSHH